MEKSFSSFSFLNIFILNMLCESCNQNPASVFVTQVINDEMTQIRLCESCARQRADDRGEASIEDIVLGLFDELDGQRRQMQNHDEANGFSVNELFMEIQNSDDLDEFLSNEDLADDMDEMDELDALDDDDFDDLSDDLAAELEAAEEAADDTFNALNELIKSGPFADAPERRDIMARRCPKCSITWDRLRQDGRAGCAHCYEVFADQLHEVMQRVQHAPQHHGKKPRAAEKRRNRLEHLRARRDHRLEMLNRRLDEAVRAEKYEEAAKLRDQIKMVESTIVSDG